MNLTPTQIAAADKLQRWKHHPDQFVEEEFGVTPDPWQREVLQAFPTCQRIAMPASKGPGKTACEAWLIWNFLLTRRHPKVAATSISEDNLRDNLWTELAKWQGKSPLLRHLFRWTKSRIEAKEAPETWWCAARSWSKTADRQQQSATLAGLHADYLLFVIDESGGVPDAVMASAEAALSTGIDTKIVQAGNTTHREGPLYRACTSERRLWKVVRISGDPDDPNRSPRVSVEWARQQIEKYGRNNPWVLVNVFGEFPPSSINTLIGPDEIMAAEKRSYREHDIAHAARVLGIDVAREGDDASVMFPRQGLVAFTPTEWRNIDGIQGAGAVSRKWDEWDADACFIDNTGGFGAAWIDCLRLLRRNPIPVLFSGEPHDKRYYNKRAEMYFDAVQWIKDGGQLPPCPELGQALTQTTYTFRGDRLLLEDKAQIKERIGMSPDHADAFVETFAEPIMRHGVKLPGVGRTNRRFRAEYDPFAIQESERIR